MAGMDSMGNRLRFARERKFLSASQAAKALGVPVSTYLAHENGQNQFDLAQAKLYGRKFNVSPVWLLSGDPEVDALIQSQPAEPSPAAEPTPLRPPSNARLLPPVEYLGLSKVPVYGQAIGGKDGRFVLNGQRVADVFAPPSLASVRNAYAVYVVGESMEPRYFAGEMVFVNPHVPVRRDDFVVIQIEDGEDGDVLGYVKRFISLDDRRLKVEQFNPGQVLEYPRDKVKAVHKIVFAGIPS